MTANTHPRLNALLAVQADTPRIFALLKYDPDQERDEHGRWASGPGGVGEGKPQSATGKHPWQMSSKEFNRTHLQHTDIRAQTPEEEEEHRRAIAAEGFKPGYMDVIPPTRGAPNNVIEFRYGTKQGKMTYAVPKEFVHRTGRMGIKGGWKPRDSEVVRIRYDHQPLHEAVVEAAVARGDPVPPKVLAEYPHLKGAEKFLKYSDDQARDERGRWTSGGGDAPAGPEAAGDPVKGGVKAAEHYRKARLDLASGRMGQRDALEDKIYSLEAKANQARDRKEQLAHEVPLNDKAYWSAHYEMVRTQAQADAYKQAIEDHKAGLPIPPPPEHGPARGAREPRGGRDAAPQPIGVEHQPEDKPKGVPSNWLKANDAATVYVTAQHLTQVSEDVLHAIDEIHADGNLGKFAIREMDQERSNNGGTTQGRYMWNDVQIAEGGKEEHVYLSHELGHRWDNMIARENGYGHYDYMSEAHTPAAQEWRDTVYKSEAVQNLVKLRDGPDKINYFGEKRDVNKAWLSYATTPREVFARAYSQYVGTRGSNLAHKTEINRSVRDTAFRLATGTPVVYTDLWQHKDFEPVAAAMDKFFEAHGWTTFKK